MATVTNADNGKCVTFREDLGQPLVYVILQPSLTPAVARVASFVAGNGEGEWHPFVEGDEVVVLIPEGYEDAGCVIVGRLNNALDPFPMDSVAGQDPTTNAFAFRRSRTPFVNEYAGPVILRSALSTALITIDETGAITLKDSENSALQISADVIGFAGPSSPEQAPEYLLQLDLTHGHFNLQVGDATFTLSRSGASPENNALFVPDAFVVGTSGNSPLEHVTTAEAVANVLEKFTKQLGLVISATGVGTGGAIGAAITAWMTGGGLATVWGDASAAPLGNTAAGLSAAVAGALATQRGKEGGGVQAFPGVGCSGFLAG